MKIPCTAPLTESFASLFKGCGFSGQRPEPLAAASGIPFLIFALRKSTKTKTKALAAASENLPFSVHGLAEQVGHSLTGKYPTGVFSRKAHGKPTCGIGFPLSCRSYIPSVQAAAVRTKKKERPSLRTVFPMSGQWPQSISLAEASDFFNFQVETRVEHRVSMGDFASCGMRLEALPQDSASLSRKA
ncbi:hypothetical protein [Butyricicoccus pullicaecorum]|uniref:hypothetical protein n=1 Tax=Butyricicoccus pullicaecorum TaxID=501571 RepID=UPI0011609674|nr:hypothetical protein [Butyricicoccus pullicaecorum]